MEKDSKIPGLLILASGKLVRRINVGQQRPEAHPRHCHMQSLEPHLCEGEHEAL